MSSGMLVPPGPVRVLVAMKPVDFRKGMNGLAALVQEQLKADHALAKVDEIGRAHV